MLRSIDLLRRHGTGSGAGILVRAVFEADLLLLYIALGGIEAFNKVVGDLRRHVEILQERNPEAEYSSEELKWVFEKDRLNLEQVARDVGPLLAKVGDRTGDATGVYDSVYRATSTYDAHGFGITATHVDTHDENLWKVLVRPEDNGISASSCLHLGAFYTAWVGQWSFKMLGFDPAPMIDYTNRLAEAFNEVLPPEGN